MNTQGPKDQYNSNKIASFALTLLLARAYAINCLVSASGAPSAMIATTRTVGCFRAAMDEAAALQPSKQKMITQDKQKHATYDGTT
jgi:hypothetical protein